MYYTGVGARGIPFEIYLMMLLCATSLEKKGYKLRSGAALGADSAFQHGILNPNNAEIFIPYRGFEITMLKTDQRFKYIVPEENKSKYFEANNLMMKNDLYKDWRFAKKDSTIKLHNRNIFQILGNNLSQREKSKFCICYTPCGSSSYDETNRNSGGTATAINAGSFYNVPVFNLKNKSDAERIISFILENKNDINYSNILQIKPHSDKFNSEKLTVSELMESYSSSFNYITESYFKELYISATKKQKRTNKPF